MRKAFARLLIAAVLATAAWLSWSESTLAARVADARQDIATLDHANLDAMTPRATLSDYLPGDRRRLSDDIRIAKATVAYWLGRYSAVAADTTDGEADAAILLATANAAFREAQRDPAVGPAAVQRLDGVLQAYAAVLKASERNTEAAYNYEYVARIRDEVARSPQGRIAKSPAAGGPIMGGDLPAGATIHGGPGAPPPDAKMEELQTIMPMEYGDREAQPEPTPGAKRERKG
ncbi:MAG TPA: hypothetical protein VFZ31_16105 [Vicinamibacterales bacterium]